MRLVVLLAAGAGVVLQAAVVAVRLAWQSDSGSVHGEGQSRPSRHRRDDSTVRLIE